MSVKQESIRKNYIFDSLSQIITMLLPLATTPYVSRILGADGVGIYSFTTANVTYFTLFGMLGISGYGKREMAIVRDNRKKSSQLFWELTILHFILLTIASISYICLIFASDKYRIYYIIQFVAILASLADINWFYQAYEKFRLISIRNCLIKLSVMIMIFSFVKDKNDLSIYILLHVSATLLGNLSLWFSLRRYVDFVPISWSNMRNHLKESLVYFIPTIAASVYSQLDKSVINWVTHSEVENGYYEQATKVMNIIHVFVQSMATVSAARMTILLSNNALAEAKQRMDKSLKFMLMIAMPCAWGVAGISSRFVPFFFGEGFDSVVVLLYIMAPLAVILGFSVYADGMYLIPSGQRARSSKAVCIGAGFNLIANFILIYICGSTGAAIATVITELLVALIMLYMSKPILNIKSIIKNMTRYCIYGFVVFCCCKLIERSIKSSLLCVLVQIAVGVVVYGVLLLITKDEIIMEFLNEFRKRKN